MSLFNVLLLPDEIVSPLTNISMDPPAHSTPLPLTLQLFSTLGVEMLMQSSFSIHGDWCPDTYIHVNMNTYTCAHTYTSEIQTQALRLNISSKLL